MLHISTIGPHTDFSFGFLHFRTCLHPDAVQEEGGCLDENCRLGDACKGNRLEWVPGSGKTKLRLSFPHHKNEAR